MEYHHCPIEPDPSDNPDEGKTCPECEGVGEFERVGEEPDVCKRCEGSGIVFYEPDEEDYR